MKYPYIKIEQPIGTFYLIKMRADILKTITEVHLRTEDSGYQRPKKDEKIKEIAAFCKQDNATFPTSIVVSVYASQSDFIEIHEDYFEIDETKVIGEVLDGQHRLEGMFESGLMERFEVPVVLMFDMSPQDNAYVFTTINSKQTKINPSLIVDLQEYSEYRSPVKTAHTIAKALNTMPESPFYGRLKMLGVNAEGQYNATLSQATFAAQIMKLYTSNAEKDARDIRNNIELLDDTKLPLRKYFIEGDDHVILKIIFNCFKAVSGVFKDETDNATKSVLWKTTGFSAIIRSFPDIYQKGERKKDLSESFFVDTFSKVREYMVKNGIEVTGEQFGGGGKQVQQNLTQWIVTAINQ